MMTAVRPMRRARDGISFKEWTVVSETAQEPIMEGQNWTDILEQPWEIVACRLIQR